MQQDNSTRLRPDVLPFTASSLEETLDLEATVVLDALTPTGKVELSTDADGCPVIATELRDLTGRTVMQRQRVRRTDVAGILSASHRTTQEPDAIDRALELMKQEVAAGHVMDLPAQRKAAPRPLPRTPRRQLRAGAGLPWLAVAGLTAVAFIVGVLM